MANELILQWSKLIPLTSNEIEALPLNGVEGVFRVSRKEQDGKFYVVFVGSSLNLGQEFSTLILQKDTNFLKQGGEFSFRYAPLKGDESRKAIEKQMYKQYAPVFNSREPQSTLNVKANLN
ncbi:MAG TPA: hypothetical protein VGP13_00905 [Candidatus Paceibacterota bacterium]|jgi:hypothetical protein|nr:hypothetical protein [Candidatus Paceibacterota bacterium]